MGIQAWFAQRYMKSHQGSREHVHQLIEDAGGCLAVDETNGTEGDMGAYDLAMTLGAGGREALFAMQVTGEVIARHGTYIPRNSDVTRRQGAHITYYELRMA